MRSVALLGGSFNPPHVGHLLLAQYVLATAPVDELWLLPTFRHAFGKDLAPYDDRLAMCELVAAELGPRGAREPARGRAGGAPWFRLEPHRLPARGAGARSTRRGAAAGDRHRHPARARGLASLGTT
jgi:hypothetical protein